MSRVALIFRILRKLYRKSHVRKGLDYLFPFVYLSSVAKKRLDALLVERDLVESRQRAQALILEGKVQVNEHLASKVGTLIPDDAEIKIREPLKYVSRGGYKLEGALDSFEIDVRGKTCADIGASTGGFTDCLLQRGARRVYSLDVGYGQIAWKIRTDPRVVVMDRVNARFLESLPELVNLATVDVSFISLTQILPAVKRILAVRGEALALIKPQFEAGRDLVGKGGIVRDVQVHRQVVEKIGRFATENGWRLVGLYRSPIAGMDGNVEFFLHVTIDSSVMKVDLDNAIDGLFGDSSWN
jgi:23S rRNA (cytidine1920-2'-O)/16S rRNA (cytidine1409-2'-O)-methyltransferase